ncbi:MAG TPA: hypothetical protein VGF86_06075 [Candidatus Tumulicola sp.]|jgi:hypothetical protein
MNAAAAAGKATLLYAADVSGDKVYVYDYRSGMLVGTLKGFNEPGPGCVDRRGDVFITNYGNGKVLQFKNGGTEPVGRYDAGAYAVGCSVDRDGDLAVSAEPPPSGAAQICVWKSGGGTRLCYSQAACGTMGAPGYDDRGNLYLEGFYAGPAICELPAGGSSLRPVAISGGTLGTPGGVMWDGKHLTFSDPHTGPDGHETTIYRARESASGDLTVVGATLLTDRCNDDYAWIDAPFIVGRKNTPVNDRQGKTVVGPNNVCDPAPIDFWPYTAGANPSRVWTQGYSAGSAIVSIGS